MTKYSLLFLSGMGTFGSGMGGIYSSFANQKSYTDKLFEEIKEQIMAFSEQYPKKDSDFFDGDWKIQEGDSSVESRNKHKNEDHKENTLNAFVYFWFGLIVLNNSILKNDADNQTDLEKFINIHLKTKFEKLSKDNNFEKIYANMKEFASSIKIEQRGKHIFIPYLIKMQNISFNKPENIANT